MPSSGKRTRSGLVSRTDFGVTRPFYLRGRIEQRKMEGEAGGSPSIAFRVSCARRERYDPSGSMRIAGRRHWTAPRRSGGCAGGRDGLEAGVHAEGAEEMPDVVPDRLGAQLELCSDLLRGATLLQKSKHLDLARGE